MREQTSQSTSSCLLNQVRIDRLENVYERLDQRMDALERMANQGLGMLKILVGVVTVIGGAITVYLGHLLIGA